MFRLVRLRVAAVDPAAQAAIDAFMVEFRPESRRSAVVAAVRRHCPQGVSVDGFTDLQRDLDADAPDALDPYDAQLAGPMQAGFRFTLFGEWVLQPTAAAPSSTPATTSSSPGLALAVRDAGGERHLDVRQLPLVVGRAAGLGEGRVDGRYVSRRHGVIDRDAAGRPWWQDTSVNGSVVDGTAVRPGERAVLADASRIRLGGDDDDPATCPDLVVRLPAPVAPAEGPTPLRVPVPAAADPSAATSLRITASPAAGAAAPTPLARTPAPPLCLLGIRDAEGSRNVPVRRLPFTLGRGEGADCRIPEAHLGVSRTHLVIERLDAEGAALHNPAAARWGTQVDGRDQAERFVLPWGRQLTLAGRYADAPSVTVLLLPPTP